MSNKKVSIAFLFQKRLDSIAVKDINDFTTYYVYKEGTCFLNNVSKRTLFDFVVNNLDWRSVSAFDDLVANGYVVEKIINNNDYVIAVQKCKDEEEKILFEFKQELFNQNCITQYYQEKAEDLFVECSKEDSLEKIEELFNRFVKCI